MCIRDSEGPDGTGRRHATQAIGLIMPRHSPSTSAVHRRLANAHLSCSFRAVRPSIYRQALLLVHCYSWRNTTHALLYSSEYLSSRSFEQLCFTPSDKLYKKKKKLNDCTIQHSETKSIDRLSCRQLFCLVLVTVMVKLFCQTLPIQIVQRWRQKLFYTFELTKFFNR